MHIGQHSPEGKAEGARTTAKRVHAMFGKVACKTSNISQVRGGGSDATYEQERPTPEGVNGEESFGLVSMIVLRILKGPELTWECEHEVDGTEAERRVQCLAGAETGLDENGRRVEGCASRV